VAALLAPELFHFPPGRILISTVGIPDAMVRCARRFPQVNLALSLHSVRQAVREQLIPLAAKYLRLFGIRMIHHPLVCIRE